MRRLLLVMAAAALMAMLLVAMAAPAMASKVAPGQLGSCGQNGVSQQDNTGGVAPGDFFTFPNPGAQGQGDQFHNCPANSPVG